MIENIRACLSALIAFGVQLDGISAKDVRDGNLKAILGLFFSLSRHKQQQKQLKLQAQHEHGDMPSRLPSPYQKTNGSSIPTPASARRPPEKRAGPPPLHQPPGVPNVISSNGSHQQSGGAHSSFIPTPHSGPREKLHHPNNLGRITPPTSSSAPPSAAGARVPSKGAGGNVYHGDAKNNNNNNNNSSMLDKLKLFNGKEKQTRNKPGSGGGASGASNGGISKRTSSSSGFSSARSERSDSSTSLYCEINPKQNPSENKSNSHEESKQHNPRPVRNRLAKQTVTTTNVSKTQRKQQPPVSNTEKERTQGEGRPEQPTIQEIEQPQSPLKQQNNEQNNTGIPKPTAAVKGVSKPVNRSRQTVALVSPMPSDMSESSQSNSTGQSSESSSVIYRPSSDSGGSDISPAKQNASPIKCISPTPTSTSIIKMPATTKIETTFDTMDKVITKESILEETLSKTTNFIVKEDEVTNCLPMQPLLRGYTRTRSSLMHQGLRNDVDSKHHIRNLHDSIVHLKRGHADGSYSDDYTNIDIAAGYLSDCGGIVGHGYPIMENGGLKSVQEVFDAGYLSEGGASSYARRLHQLSQRPHLNGSVDISSKLHSTDDHGVPHSQKRITRTSVSGTINGGLGGGGGGKYGKVMNVHHENQPPPPPPGQPPPPPPPGHPHHVIYRSHHQRPSNKMDSDHPSDMHPPPYRLPPGGNGWPDHSTNTSVARMPELQRGKSDLELIRSKRHHHHHASSTTPAGSPSSQQLHQQHSSSSAGSQQQQNMNGAMSARTRLERSRKIGSGSKDDICNGSSEKGRGPPPAPAPNGHSQPPAPAPVGNLPLRNGDSHSGKSTSKVRGVPQSFGYVKRSGGSTTSGPVGSGGPNNKNEPRTAQVTAVPRTKVKVSGGTQTCTSDLHQHKSYSLTGPAAGQLSQGVRERLLLGSHSLPKPAALQRPYRPSDGSLSDTVYSDLQSYYTSSPYSNWLRYSAAYTSSLPSRASAGGLVEADSMESLSSLPAQLQHRASLTHARLLMHQRENSGSPVPRLSRSNSIRSTKSEKLYPSMLQRSDEQDPYYGIPIMPVVPTAASSALSQSHHSSQPTSPTPSQSTAASRYNSSTMSPIASSASSYGLSRTSMSIFSGLLGGKTSSKDDDVHGSSASLVSTASSLYSTPEEKQAHEIRKLKRELLDAQEKVHTLTSQLSTNAHVVSAFEQSLSNMTQRLQHLTSTAERKDSELLELRQTIELLRKQSVEAGLTSAHLQNMSPLLNRRNFDGNTITPAQANMARQLSADSVSSLNSLSSACSLGSSQHTPSTGSGKKKKKGWLRSSFSRAFSRSKKNKNGSVSDVEDSRGLHSDISAPSSPLLSGVPHHPHLSGNGSNTNGINAGANGINGGLKTSQSSSAIYQKDAEVGPEVVEELKKQLREKDLVLTDIRLEALSSAHQLESLKDTVIKMRNEMLNLKQDNERLQRIVTSKSLTSSQSSLPRTESLERRLSMTEPPTSALFCADGISTSGDDSRKLLVSVLLGSHGSYQKYLEEGEGPDGSPPEAVISAVLISTKTSWDLLDCIVRRTFKDYISRVDSASSLGLSVESIWSYHVGEMVRYSDGPTPELLPHGYLDPGDSGNVRVCLKGALHGGCVDALAFETLIPKSILQRYICLLTEHRRIILCGPSGTGKSYLANKLAEFLVLRDGKESTAESIATFNVDHKSSKELRQYLANLAEQCESNAADLPSVIILDQLHHASSLGEVFNGFLNAKYNKCPYIIGTMNQATCSTTNLQLHHNFRWVLCANHMEPVKGFLGRYLRRRLIETEARSGVRHAELTRVIEWMSKVWHHLNKFLETHSSSDVTIGPRLFLSCPTDITGSQVWFTDLWNYSVVPYLMEAVREGLQLYGRRAPWEDPAEFICQTYPWPLHSTSGGPESLLRLRPEDVGYNTHTHGSGTGIGGGAGSVKSLGSAQSDTEGDPLLNMLMRLQEAANYSSPPSNDSDLSGSLSDAGSRVESTL